MKTKNISGLHFVTPNSTKGLVEKIKAYLSAGGDWVQLRLKEISDDEFLKLGETIKTLQRAHSFKLIINDRVHIAKALDADGVHVGLTDLSVTKAREILGDEKIIGGTANTLEDILRHQDQGADYVGLGPFAFTTTKKNLSPELGLAGYEQLLNSDKISIPIIAIGGIKLTHVKDIMNSGVHGIALSGLINDGDITDNTWAVLSQLKLEI